MIHGIETVSYPNIKAVSDYENLSEDQKAAYDAIGGALADIIKNQPDEGKSYPIKKRVSIDDCLSVSDMLSANFTAAEDILTALTYTDSHNSDDHADAVVLPAPDDAFTESYKECINTIKLAENVLKDIDSDGTEYGKALAIAQWMIDKVKISDLDYNTPSSIKKKPNTAYGALANKEADSEGAAKLYALLCQKAGLEAIYVTGEEQVGIAWNMMRINEKWYHINIRLMDGNEDIYQYFMMPDSVYAQLAKYTVRYYFDRAADEWKAPVADSYDLYKYAYESLEDMIDSFESSIEIKEYSLYFGDTDDKVISFTGEIKSKLDGSTYYMKMYELASEMYNVHFVKKIEAVPAENGMHTIEYKPNSVVCDFDGEPMETAYDADWMLTMNIPDYIVEDPDNDGTYNTFDKTQFYYRTVLYFFDCIKVDSDYVMDDSVKDLEYNIHAPSYVQSSCEIWQGKTGEGYDYVLYSNAYTYNAEYYACVYIRVTDEYIISFEYNGGYNDLPGISELLASVKVIRTK